MMMMTMTLLYFLGSYAHASIPKFSEVVANAIYRGGQPEEKLDYDELQNKYHIQTVINLRTSGISSEEDEVQSRGIKFVSLPINPVVPVSRETIDKALWILSHESYYPVFIHCRHGSDRTGLVIGLYRSEYQGWTKDQAYEEMREFGFRSYLFFLKRFFWKY